MASKPTATRASSRSKVTAAAAAKAPAPARTTRTRAASKAPSTASESTDPVPAKKATGRKPLEKRDNIDVPAPSKSKAKAPSSKSFKQVLQSDADREPITAYLRIRPHLGEESSSSPYLVPISDTSVKMTDPQDTQNTRPQYRASVASPSSIYTFSHVFPPNTTQLDFFTKTTLPLVKDLLYGQSGLLFTYGVTNSGKTYTVQGGEEKATAGILPRTLDVIFNSIDGLHGEGKYRPCRLYGVEPADAADSVVPQLAPEPDLAEVFRSLDEDTNTEFDADPTTVPVDRNHEYTVWLSYVEVYNEKVYDLLADAKGESDMHVDSPAPRTGNSKSLLLSRKALTLRPSPQSDNPDAEVNGKYISGLRQFRIRSASQAKALVKLGQLHRRVFGTLANRESSRSHGMVIIKVIRGHRGDRNDPSALQVSRLTLVDLAGSERTKHTQTTGERLKEAGSINKSLMVLGQCMEVLRSNQRKLAMSLAHEGAGSAGRMDTRDVKRTLAVVPFRHSKLTECLIDYFVGDGRVVMIVNINPYDTGYDENSHVMKFASLAKEIFVTPAAAPLQKAPPVPFMPGKLKGHKFKELGPLTLKDPEIVPKLGYRRKVTISMGGNEKGKQIKQAILEVLEEDEPQDEGNDDDDGDDEPANPLIDALFDEIENLRFQLFEAEMRSAIIEAETREEVMREMEERMRLMEQKYSRRLMSEMERNEMKTDAKIDMLHQAGLFGSPMKVRTAPAQHVYSEDEEEDVEMSLIEYGPEGDEDSDDDMNITAGDRSRSASPLARKERLLSEKSGKQPSTPKMIIEKRKFIPDPAPLPSDTEDAELSEIEEDEEAEEEDEDEDGDEDETGEDEDGDDDYSEEESDEEDDWVPPPPASARKAAAAKASSSARSASINTPTAAKPRKVSKLADDKDSLSMKGARAHAPTPATTSKKKIRKSALSDSEDEEDAEPEATPVAPKKKRQLAKKPIMTVDGVEAVTWEAEKLNAQGSKTIRRLGN
ncbi:hypothetical protein MD484_g150, partial [Candolleomyces efflorescens]